MAPKGTKKAVTAAPASGPAQPVVVDPYAMHEVNKDYYVNVIKDVQIIKEKWPTITSLSPLPMSGDDGFLGLAGFGEPFDTTTFNARVADAEFAYQCHVNAMWFDPLRSVLNFVPLYWERVMEFAQDNLKDPILTRFPITVQTDFSQGVDLPKGALLRISPCETYHALLHRVATVVANPQSTESDMRLWLRVLLSFPVIFKKFKDDDARYAEANSLREDATTLSRAVRLSCRQFVRNIIGFKLRKESVKGVVCGAAVIAKFWEQSVRVSTGNKSNYKKSAIDCAFTLFERVFSIDGVEDIVARGEAQLNEPENFWMSLWRLQEVVYRCGRKEKILWVLQCVEDNLASGRLQHADISISTLKTGTRSHTDVWLQCYANKLYLLGSWLDGKDFPAYAKAKARELFNDHASYRKLYAPIVATNIEIKESGQREITQSTIDTTWLFSWPKVCKDLLEFLEGAIYAPTSHEEFCMRTAVKNASTASELMTFKPWSDTVAALNDQLRATAAPGVLSHPQTDHDMAADDSDADTLQPGSTTAQRESSQQLLEAVHRLMNHQSKFLVEAGSFLALKQQFESCPLCLVQMSQESGMVMILMDCNVWGEADHRPWLRLCPIGKDKFDLPQRALLAARQGTDTPTELQFGDLWTCITGGKDRKRFFVKPLKNPDMKTGRDRQRTLCRTMTLTLDEPSWRLRHFAKRGTAKLTQHIHIVANASTLAGIPYKQFPTIPGSNRSDVLGPLTLQPLEDMPKMSLDAKKVYYNKRMILAGGGKIAPNSDNDSDDDDDEDDAAAKPKETDDPPISWAALPVELMSNLCKGYNVKHVIDLSPTPEHLAFEIISQGGSYVALCASTEQKDFLTKQLFDDLLVGITDCHQPLLYDPRFSIEAAAYAGDF